MRGGCGSEVVLETVNAPRAFLTTDSGFPLNDLEQALRTNHPFTYDFHPTAVPVMFGPEYWSGPKEKEGTNFIENFISDPSALPPLSRLFQARHGDRRSHAQSGSPSPASKPIRTCSISSAACSKSATAKP